AARKRGAVLGRRRKLTDRQVLKGMEKLEAGSHTFGEVASMLGVHPRTLSRAIKRLQVSET
ncbi:MAG: recombinase family protein, partial [Pseudomonadota bacterium]